MLHSQTISTHILQWSHPPSWPTEQLALARAKTIQNTPGI